MKTLARDQYQAHAHQRVVIHCQQHLFKHTKRHQHYHAPTFTVNNTCSNTQNATNIIMHQQTTVLLRLGAT